MKPLHLLLVGLGCLLLAGCGGGDPAEAQSDRDQQLSWGAAIYRFECARCHEPDRGAPELSSELLIQYGDAQSLFEFVRSAMPLDRPGSLPEAQYWDVTAHILDEAGLLQLPPGERLSEETASEVDFTAGSDSGGSS